MSRLNIAKIILYLFGVAWATLFIWMGISIYLEAPEQLIRDKKFIANEIDPSIRLIEAFKTTNHRLPTLAEFSKLSSITSLNLGNVEYIRSNQSIDSEIKENTKGIDWKTDYVLSVWRGSWAEYYISKKHQYITNNYTIWDGVEGMAIAVLIGVLPLGGLLFYQRNKYSKANKSHNIVFG